jgi:hypothetical protein
MRKNKGDRQLKVVETAIPNRCDTKTKSDSAGDARTKGINTIRDHFTDACDLQITIRKKGGEIGAVVCLLRMMK